MNKQMLGAAMLAFCIATAQDASAQTNLHLESAGIQVGIVSPENVDATVGIGAFADLGTLAPRLRLSSHLDFWSKSQSAFGSDVSFSDVALSVRGKYLFPVTSPHLQPYAGAGLGLHFVHAKVQVIDLFTGLPMTAEDSSTKLGLDLGGGVTSPLGPKTDLQGELWYGVVEDVSQLSLKVGLAFRL
jgi:opacity protein-like surface antigen